MTDVCRSEVTLFFSGDVPKDYITNTLYFTRVDGATMSTGDFAAIATALKNLYSGAAVGSTTNLYLSGLHNNVNCYLMSDPEPRQVRGNATFTPSSPAARSGFGPPQVAMCLSCYAGRNIVGSRSRLYIGPIGQADCTERPSSTLQNAVLSYAHGFFRLGGTTYAHIIYHLKNTKSGHSAGSFDLVTDYWVGNEFVTQRRRGDLPTSRIAWHGS